MAAPAFGAANLQWVGLALETTYGTPAAAPTVWVPVDTPTWHAVQPKMVDQALRGSMSMDFQQLLGMRDDEVAFKTYFYLDSAYFLLRTALGLPDVVTGSSAPYTHKTSVQSGNNGQPAGTTIWWYDPSSGQCWRMPGSQVADAKITLTADGLATIDMQYICLPGTAVTAPTNTPTTAQPMPSWNSVVSVASAANLAFSEIDIEIKRATEPVISITGSQTPVAIFAGPVEVTGSLTAIYQGVSDVNLVDYLANTQPSFTVTTKPQGDAVHSIALQCSQLAYDDAQPSGTNKWMEIKATTTSIANATDVAGGGNVSPLLVTCIDAVSTAH